MEFHTDSISDSDQKQETKNRNESLLLRLQIHRPLIIGDTKKVILWAFLTSWSKSRQKITIFRLHSFKQKLFFYASRLPV